MAKIGTKLKFPVLNDVDYFDAVKNKQTLKSFKGSEINGLKWRELQQKLGALFGNGSVHYTMKLNNDDNLYRGTIRMVQVGITAKNPIDENSTIKLELDQIKNQISNLGNAGGVSVDLLLSITKQSYETQITFLNNELNRKEITLTKYLNDIEKLNDELQECYELIDDLKSKTGLTQYLELAKTFLNSKSANLKPIQTLKDSDPTDIPERILKILGAVDWNQIEQNNLDEIIRYLEMFITKLPLK